MSADLQGCIDARPGSQETHIMRQVDYALRHLEGLNLVVRDGANAYLAPHLVAEDTLDDDTLRRFFADAVDRHQVYQQVRSAESVEAAAETLGSLKDSTGKKLIGGSTRERRVSAVANILSACLPADELPAWVAAAARDAE